MIGSPAREIFVRCMGKILVYLKAENRHNIDICAAIKEAEAEFDKICQDCPARPQLPKIECQDLDDIYCE